MSKKDLLKQKAKGKLAISKNASVKKPSLAIVVKDDDLKKITRDIRSSLEEMQDIHEWWKDKKERVSELKELIIEKLVYVRKSKKKLLGSRTFEDYLVNDIGISKGYFYEQLQAYNVCMEYNKPALFKEVDPKVLVGIAREKDPARQKELMEKAPKLSREYFKKVRPSDFSEEETEGAKSTKGLKSTALSDIKITEHEAMIMHKLLSTITFSLKQSPTGNWEGWRDFTLNDESLKELKDIVRKLGTLYKA